MAWDAFAPPEYPLVAAGALLVAGAAWLLYLDFNHRVVRAMALFLALRGLSNLITQFSLAPGSLPEDWMVWRRFDLYLINLNGVAAVYVLLAFQDPDARGRWVRPAVWGLAAAGVGMVVATALLMPAGFPLEPLVYPHPLAFAQFLRYPVYALVALLLVRGASSAEALRVRGLAAFAFLADAVFLATTAVGGVGFGILGATRILGTASLGALLHHGLTLVLAASVPVVLYRKAPAEAMRPFARRLGGALVAPAACGLAVVASLLLAPGWTLPLFNGFDAVWTAALPVLFAAAVVRGRLFSIRPQVRRAIRQSTLVSAFLAVFVLGTQAAQAFAPPGTAPLLGIVATGVLLLVVARLQRFAEGVADRAVGGRVDPLSAGDLRRLDGYRAALERSLAADGSVRADQEPLLASLRRELGVSEQQHALLHYTLRTTRAPSGKSPGLRPGERFLGRYHVQRELGRGGSGTTYLAEDEQVHRNVVVKHLRPTQGGAEGTRALLREARAIASLQHPRVVTLFDVQQVGDDVFTIMEHVPGGSLAQRLAKGPLTVAEFRRTALDLLSALDAVHAAGIVHRDVKPSNVLLAHDGGAKLADFGVAHLPGFEATLAGDAQSTVGTVRYMSPEQALGHATTPRSDLYSAAATLYEARTGRRFLDPKPGESAIELQMRAANPAAFDGRAIQPPALRAWFARALAPRPEQRFPDARAMAKALGEALDMRPRRRRARARC